MTTNALPRKILFWSAGAIALAVLAWQAMRDPVQMASVVPVSRGPLEQSFLEEGKTRLKQRYVITAPLAGVVRRIRLQPGDAVQARQVVAEIDPTGSALLDPRSRSQALAEVSTGQSALNAARQRVAAVTTTEAVAQGELRRLQQLREQGMVTASQLDQARAQVASAPPLDAPTARSGFSQRNPFITWLVGVAAATLPIAITPSRPSVASRAYTVIAWSRPSCSAAGTGTSKPSTRRRPPPQRGSATDRAPVWMSFCPITVGVELAKSTTCSALLNRTRGSATDNAPDPTREAPTTVRAGSSKPPTIMMFENVFEGGILINKEDLYAALIAAVLVGLLTMFFQKTSTGRALRAVADDPQAAQSIGIPLNRIWVIVWCVAGIVALVAGMIWGSKLGVQFSLATVALRALPVVILGGLTSVPGAIIGGLIIGVGEKLSEVYLGPFVGGGIEIWFAYVLALVFLLFRPQGLFGEKIIDRV